MKYDTKLEACRAWVNEFNAIPTEIVRKLKNEVEEITPVIVGARVYVYDSVLQTEQDCEGCLISINTTNATVNRKTYTVRLDSGEELTLTADQFEPIDEVNDWLPMWGTMWTFGDSIDNDWLSGEFGTDGLQKMAECGFRIYTQEDFGYIFGIDGAGYDFYADHWLPLYDARGLHWHKEEENEANKESEESEQ